MLEILRDGFKSNTITVFNYAHLLKQLKCEGKSARTVTSVIMLRKLPLVQLTAELEILLH